MDRRLPAHATHHGAGREWKLPALHTRRQRHVLCAPPSERHLDRAQRVSLLPGSRQGLGRRPRQQPGVREDRSGCALVGRPADHGGRRLLPVLLLPEHLYTAALVQQLVHAQLHGRDPLRRPDVLDRHAGDEAGRGRACARSGADPGALLQGTRRRLPGALPVAQPAHLGCLRGS